MTTLRIYRYEVPVDGRAHGIELWGNPLAVECNRRDDLVEFWAYHVDGALTTTRYFMVVGTGHPLPEHTRGYVGTAFAARGSLVRHLIELSPPAVAALPADGTSALAPAGPG